MSMPKSTIIYKCKPSRERFRIRYGLYFFLIQVFYLSSVSIHSSLQAQNYSNKIKVVLDAGHGGKDPGAVGNRLQEKQVALATTLKVGSLLEAMEDVEVIYTRKTDEFIGLKQRADIANKNKADLFISIHCNGVASPSPRGFETFVFGIARNKDNLETARRENSVIYFEEDYEIIYSNYNPDSPESILTYTLMQEEYLDQSILLASYVQKNVVNKLKQKDRGVKQDNFLVLRETYMPSILIELGFITNPTDASFLKTEVAKNQLAKEIVEAIKQYKKNINIIDLNEEVASIKKEQEEVMEQLESESTVVYRVQIAAGATKLDLVPSNFKGLEGITMDYQSGLYKYYYKSTFDYQDAQENLKIAKGKGYESAFIIAYDTKIGKKISVSNALKTKPN